MGKVTGFKEFQRVNFDYKSVEERIINFKEFLIAPKKSVIQNQASRCMECGVPFCHSNFGCPLGNVVPEFNDQVYNKKWKEAYYTISTTNNFPEFTGRVCPATCESACVLGINESPVSIKNIEYSIIEYAFKNGWVKPKKPKKRTGKSVAIIGSGPAGLAAADELNKLGHSVSVYEKDLRVGGLLRYGIPNFKLDKLEVVQRRIDILVKEGVEFITNANVGVDIKALNILEKFDATIVAIGAGEPRDLNIPNRDANGIYFAMEFLSQANCKVEGDVIANEINAANKHVVVIGGGDTGSDCVGTAIRQGAKSVTQIELLPKAPMQRTVDMPWPTYPRLFKISSSQAEGCKLDFCVLSKSFIKNTNGVLCGINCIKIEWIGRDFREVKGSEFAIEADLALLAMGFLGPIQNDVIKEFNLQTDSKSNIIDNNYKTSNEKVFCAGDARRGQSLIVWAIKEGRECAKIVNKYLSKPTTKTQVTL